MKELTIEEKARVYDSIIEKANKMHSKNCEACQACIEELIPELAESNDEKVREELIKHLKEGAEGYEPAGNSQDYARWLSWLEKQGGHANFRNKIQVGDKVTRNEAGVLVNISQLNRVAKKNEKQGEQKFEMKSAEESLGIDSDTYNKIVDECIFGEQKPANKIEPKDYSSIDPHFGKPIDKVEPKFHEGEWITNDDYIWKIVEVKPLDYVLQSQDGNIVDDTISHVDEQFHSFTIADAKSGDVLYTPKGCGVEGIFLIEGWKQVDDTGKTLCSNIGYRVEDDEIIAGGLGAIWWEGVIDPFYPATKEQRDTLMKAMADAGYTFDFEKKELKEIGQNPAEWNEEDEEIINKINAIANQYSYSTTIKIKNWLKSLRPQNTYNPYKAVVESIAEMCKHYDKASHSGLRDFYDNVKVKCKDAQEYDSLYPQSRWKPSELQLGCLSDAIEHYNSLGYPAPKLKELLDDLKKLKEE